jgi:hypothetical protein
VIRGDNSVFLRNNTLLSIDKPHWCSGVADEYDCVNGEGSSRPSCREFFIALTAYPILSERSMARVLFELSDFAPLVHEIAKRRRPLLATTFSHGPRLLQVHLDVTLHALDTIESDGPITVESEFQPGEKWLDFKAVVPRMNLKIPCTLKRGTLLIKDGDWPLEVSFQCSIAGQIHLIGGPGDEPLATASERRIQVEFKNFELRCPAFPHWLVRPMQPILERMLETIIGEIVPVEVRRPLTGSRRVAPGMQTATVVEQWPACRQPRKSGAIYKSAYYLGYGLTIPAAWISWTLLGSTTAASGLRDGANSAARSVEQLAEHWTGQLRSDLDSSQAAPAVN